MATKRPLTESEHKKVCAALPRHLRPIMDHVEWVQESCRHCENRGIEDWCGTHLIKIPEEQVNETQPCFEMMIFPF